MAVIEPWNAVDQNDKVFSVYSEHYTVELSDEMVKHMWRRGRWFFISAGFPVNFQFPEVQNSNLCLTICSPDLLSVCLINNRHEAILMELGTFREHVKSIHLRLDPPKPKTPMQRIIRNYECKKC